MASTKSAIHFWKWSDNPKLCCCSPKCHTRASASCSLNCCSSFNLIACLEPSWCGSCWVILASLPSQTLSPLSSLLSCFFLLLAFTCSKVGKLWHVVQVKPALLVIVEASTGELASKYLVCDPVLVLKSCTRLLRESFPQANPVASTRCASANNGWSSSWSATDRRN